MSSFLKSNPTSIVRWLLLAVAIVWSSGVFTHTWASEPSESDAAGKTEHADQEDHNHTGKGAEGHAEESHGGGGLINPLVIDPDLAIWTAIIFGLLLAVLYKYAWGPIVEALDQREQTVQDHLAAAEAKHEEAKGLLAAHEARLATAKDEVREMLEEARRDAEATKTQIVAEADATAKANRDRAVRDVEQARDGAVRHLAETSANLAVDLAGKVIKQSMTPDQQAELVREATTRLANSSPSSN